VPSCILIHPTVWPQYIIVTDSTDRQDRQTVYTNIRFANHYLSSFFENFKLISVVFGKFSVFTTGINSQLKLETPTCVHPNPRNRRLLPDVYSLMPHH